MLLAALFVLASCASSGEATSSDQTGNAVDQSTTDAVSANDSELLPVSSAPQFGRSSALVTVSAFVDPSNEEFPKLTSELLELVAANESELRLVLHPTLDTTNPGLQAWRLLHFAAARGEFSEGIDFLTKWHEIWRTGDPITLAIAMNVWEAEDLLAYLSSEEFKSAHLEQMAWVRTRGLSSTSLVVNGVFVEDTSALRGEFIRSLAAAQALVAEGAPRAEIYALSVETAADRGRGFATLVDSEKVPVGKSPTLGRNSAPVTIVGFMDLQCPYCARAWGTMREVQSEYGDSVRFVWKHHPLAFHRQAKDAAVAAEAARRQGKFFEFSTQVFERQKALKNNHEALFLEIADAVGIEKQQFLNDLKDPVLAARVEADAALAKELGQRGTPAFFVNGEKVVGAQPKAKFVSLIDQELLDIRAALESGELSADRIYADRVALNLESDTPASRPTRKKAGPAMVEIKPRDAMRGPPTAPVTVVIFSDFQCPFCARANPTLEALAKKYGQDIRFVFKHLPLPFHAEAKEMAYTALAAGEQGKFWEMHDLLFQNQRSFKGDPDGEAEKLAQQLQLDMNKFRKDYASKAIRDQVDADLKVASDLDVRGTPNFLINGVRLTGAKPQAEFEAVIDEQLERAKRLLKSGTKPADIYEAAVKANQREHGGG